MQRVPLSQKESVLCRSGVLLREDGGVQAGRDGAKMGAGGLQKIAGFLLTAPGAGWVLEMCWEAAADVLMKRTTLENLRAPESFRPAGRTSGPAGQPKFSPRLFQAH